MLDFVDTKLFKSGETVRVMLYSDNRKKTLDMFHSLIEGENIVEQAESYSQLRALVEKDDIKVLVVSAMASNSARGYRSQYAVIDKNLFGQKHGAEIFHQVIQPSNIFYSHLLRDGVEQPKITMLLF